jgi:hypothetical protein
MTGQLSMFDQTMSEDSGSVTSSPALVAGPTRSSSPAGATARSGPAAAPASRSAPPAPRLAAMMPATFGRPGFSSSRSAALTSSLVSRLRRRLDTAGSTGCVMTWKRRTTPSGRVCSLLRASARSTSGTGSGSWPSPAAEEPGGTLDAYRTRNRHHAGGMGQLAHAVQLATWPTPIESDAETACVTDQRLSRAKGVQLRETATWVTPSARDWKDSPGMATTATNPDGSVRTRLDLLPRQAYLTGPMSFGCPAGMAKRGQLNPAFSLWLMGFPTAWASCAARVTRLCRPSRRSLSKRISTP